jgi:hypothetical protein
LPEQKPIEIYRNSVPHDPGGVVEQDDSHFFEERTMEKIQHSPSFRSEQEKKIFAITPRIHFELNMIKCDHLNMFKSIENPTQSRKIQSEFLEEDGSEQLVGESSQLVLPSEFHEGLDVPDVDGDVRSWDVVSFHLENPSCQKSQDLCWSDGQVLTVGVDGDRTDDSIGHTTKMREGQKDVPHVPLMNGTLSNGWRAAKNEQKTRRFNEHGFFFENKKKWNEKIKKTYLFTFGACSMEGNRTGGTWICLLAISVGAKQHPKLKQALSLDLESKKEN